MRGHIKIVFSMTLARFVYDLNRNEFRHMEKFPKSDDCSGSPGIFSTISTNGHLNYFSPTSANLTAQRGNFIVTR